MKPALLLATAFLASMAQAFVPLSTANTRSAASTRALQARGSSGPSAAGDKDVAVSRQGFLGGLLSGGL